MSYNIVFEIILCKVVITERFSKEEVVELFRFKVVFSEQHVFTSGNQHASRTPGGGREFSIGVRREGS